MLELLEPRKRNGRRKYLCLRFKIQELTLSVSFRRRHRSDALKFWMRCVFVGLDLRIQGAVTTEARSVNGESRERTELYISEQREGNKQKSAGSTGSEINHAILHADAQLPRETATLRKNQTKLFSIKIFKK